MISDTGGQQELAGGKMTFVAFQFHRATQLTPDAGWRRRGVVTAQALAALPSHRDLLNKINEFGLSTL